MNVCKEISEIQLFHVHIPKTAGTSLNKSLEHVYGEVFASHDPERMRKDPGVRVAAAHTTFRSARVLFPNAKLVTVLRDPVSRFKSTLRHLYARRNWPNYADIGPIIDEFIDSNGYVRPKSKIILDEQFISRFDNLMVRYLTAEPVTGLVTSMNMQSAIDSLPQFYKILYQHQFSEDVVQFFRHLGCSHIKPVTTNRAKSQIPLWDTIPGFLEEYLEFDLALYKAALSATVQEVDLTGLSG